MAGTREQRVKTRYKGGKEDSTGGGTDGAGAARKAETQATREGKGDETMRHPTEAGEADGKMDEGGDGHVGGSTMDRHAVERTATAKRHDTERADMHKQHGAAHKSMLSRHEREMAEMRARHEQEMGTNAASDAETAQAAAQGAAAMAGAGAAGGARAA